MSSRNVYLSAEQRQEAAVLYRALESGRVAIETGDRDPGTIRERMAEGFAGAPLAALDYAEVVDALTLEQVPVLVGELRLLVAARFGSTRLLDNLGITVPEGRSGAKEPRC
jgi:pantoate--beta-alanine ligase